MGRYLLLRRLATGGMGEIILAEQTGLSGFSKRVVIKRIRSDLAVDTDYVRLFLNEARTGSFLNHPNIVHVLDVGHDDDQLYLVLEYVDGIDLKRLTRRASLAGHALSGPTLAALSLDVLEALSWAHTRSPITESPIIHRDISPENLLVTRGAKVKVLDFGLAKWWPSSTTVPSLEGRMIFGKVRYMPPEQLKGHPIDARADLYSLGAVLYEALSGHLPFGRGSASQILERIRSGLPPPPTVDWREPDPALDDLIAKALAPRPEDRFPSAEAMRSAFVEYLRDRNRVLPLERLRRLLQPSSRSPEFDSGPAEPLSPTVLDLPVAERCGKCGGELRAFVLDDLILDQCQSCQGVWVDRAELDRILGHGLSGRLEAASADRALPDLDPVLGSCPVDRVGLMAFQVPGRSISLEACPHCHGMWFDRDELAVLQEGRVVSWLRSQLSSLEAP